MVKDLDPIIEKVILRCLEENPHRARRMRSPSQRRCRRRSARCRSRRRGNTFAANGGALRAKRRSAAARSQSSALPLYCWVLGRSRFFGIHYSGLEQMRLELTAGGP